MFLGYLWVEQEYIPADTGRHLFVVYMRDVRFCISRQSWVRFQMGLLLPFSVDIIDSYGPMVWLSSKQLPKIMLKDEGLLHLLISLIAIQYLFPSL